MRWLLTTIVLLLPSAALACPTCGTASVPGMNAEDLPGGYPLQFERSGARITLEGARDRVIRFEDATPDPLALYVAGDLLASATVAAGFSWQASKRLGVHVCGPEITLSLTLP